jgi:prolyl oligopeptidase
MRAIATALLVACGSTAAPPSKPVPPTPPPPEQVVDATDPPAPKPDDPYLWLEDVTADKSLAWVRERNATTQAELEAVPGFATTRDRVRAILDSKDKTPYVVKRGARLYNTWTDDKNPRGLIRRTTLAEYKKDKPSWETVLDIDALGAAEKESWVYEGMTCVYPKYDRCLVSLSRGGADATVVREFDAETKKFVDGGFALPEAKSTVSWKDHDTIYVATDFGPGTMTAAGYPRIVKEWKRGTKLADAVTIFEGQATDVSIGASREHDHGRVRDWVSRGITTYTNETYLRTGDKLEKIDAPLDADVGAWDDQITITLRSDWEVGGKTWPKGALLVMSLDDFRGGRRDFTMLYEPGPTRSLESVASLKTSLVFNQLVDVHHELYAYTRAAGKWVKKPFAVAAGPLDAIGVWAVDGDGSSDDFWQSTNGFLTPDTLSLGTLDLGQGPSSSASVTRGGKPAQALKHGPAHFDAKGLAVEQHFATSKDGTRVPYFQIARKDVALDGSSPTILYGYGGFEISLTPGYDPVTGASWLERGGVYVSANIRGGGEYGPAWHQAALKHDRQHAYDDFIAVAEDLIARKVTSTPHLGIHGGSNGGLLMGVMLVERPDLFGAIVSQAPLLDMKRYHKLLAGASWMEEYGDPDNADDWAALAKFSPYQNVKAGTKYPLTLFTSSTRDDRVHPGHARKMVARMLEQGHDVRYYENIEGGHGGAADAAQYAYMTALAYSFFAKQLGLR